LRGSHRRPEVTSIADKHGKTPAQVALRWHIDHGVVAIPKSVKPHRIAENADYGGWSPHRVTFPSAGATHAAVA
jgi:diketogulonate reductase-like aldo/keto reductase